ncbi:HNH endonuclease [Enterococcus faecalis]|uniref:HNH endonuclease n=1 Tax=Enterococcus faecalis TaxID=1351 RepID=UPI003F7E88C9
MFDKLDQPKIYISEVIEAIKNSYERQSAHSRKITHKYEDHIKKYENEYFTNKRYRLKPIEKIDEVDKDVSKFFYEKKIVDARLANLYDTILRLNTAVCPVCGAHGDTLDHVLPKQSFVQYTLTPINMIPMCGRCNRIKGEFFSNESDKEIFHPYFEEYNNLRGLKAEYKIIDSNFIPYFYLDEKIAGKKWTYNFINIFELNNVLSALSIAKINNLLVVLRRSKNTSNHMDHCLREIKKIRKQSLNTSWENVLFDLILLNYDDFYSTV